MIGSYWNGIGLGLTCKWLAHLLDPDRHFIVHQRDVGIVSRLPNKWLHGTAVIDMYDGTERARVECYRGAVISAETANATGFRAHHGIYRGYWWTWSSANVNVYLRCDPTSHKICTEDEITHALDALTRGMPDGKTRTLNAYMWPGLIFCAKITPREADRAQAVTTQT